MGDDGCGGGATPRLAANPGSRVVSSGGGSDAAYYSRVCGAVGE